MPSPGTATYAVMQNRNCATSYLTLWPGATYVHAQEARENPAIFFRRALKIVNGAARSTSALPAMVLPQILPAA
jgi:hypothetical protein